MLENDVVRGQTRNYYSVRLIGLCMAAAALMAACITIGVTLWLSGNIKATLYQGAVKACERGNDVRRESNARITEHELDRDNLRGLAAHLSTNRGAEASTFAAIGGAFGIEKKVEPLVRLLRGASATDQAIADSQATVRFSRLPTIPCHDTRFVPKP